MALTTLDSIKAYLGITTNTEDARLLALMNAADTIIKQHVGRDIESVLYGTGATTGSPGGDGDAGYYSGDNTRLLLLRNRPVTAITSIYEDQTGYFGDNPDGAFASATLLVSGTDYVIRWDGTLPGLATKCSHCGIVEKLTGVWNGAWMFTRGSINPTLTNQRGNIKVTYTAGYTTIPYDIQYAVSLLVAFMRRTAIYGGMPIESEGYEDYHYSLARQRGAVAIEQIGDLKAILARYKEVFISCGP